MGRDSKIIIKEQKWFKLRFKEAAIVTSSHISVSYTHLDVYKRQPLMKVKIRFFFKLFMLVVIFSIISII